MDLCILSQPQGDAGTMGHRRHTPPKNLRGKKWRWWKIASRGVARRIRTMLKKKKKATTRK